ncbi:uncharacterized protein LOC135206468 [Macrobrachium nipponense]|uniref:uncharacterized protein LOC135206468 n=1 Tax=Macrobrachium nipponense TaxID=159736 RepID=UPI0030C847E8
MERRHPQGHSGGGGSSSSSCAGQRPRRRRQNTQDVEGNRQSPAGAEALSLVAQTVSLRQQNEALTRQAVSGGTSVAALRRDLGNVERDVEAKRERVQEFEEELAEGSQVLSTLQKILVKRA